MFYCMRVTIVLERANSLLTLPPSPQSPRPLVRWFPSRPSFSIFFFHQAVKTDIVEYTIVYMCHRVWRILFYFPL